MNRSLKLSTFALIISAIFFMTSGGVIYFFTQVVNKNSAEAFQEKTRSWARHNIQNSVESLLFYGDEEELEVFAENYVKHPDIYSLKIEDSQRTKITAAQDKGKHLREPEVIIIRHISEDSVPGTFTKDKETILGYVYVTFSDEFAVNTLEEGWKLTLIIVLLATIIMTLCLYSAITLVDRHLKRTNSQAEQMTRGVFSTIEKQSVIKELDENTHYLNNLSNTLEKTINELQSTSSIKSKLLSVASHDLRQPMNSAIPQMAFVLDKLSVNEPIDEMTLIQLKDINESMRLMAILMDELSDYNAIKSGKMRLSPSVFRPESIFYDSFRSISQNNKPNVDLELEAEKSTEVLANSLIETDRAKLTSIAINLLDNAFKFTSLGEVKLTWWVDENESGHCWVCFKVQDTGTGIAEDKIDKIFEDFYQERLEADGWGLGLWKVSKYVDLLKGSIEVESTPGIGSTFTVRIPVKHHSKKAFKASISLPENTKVMVVDDNIGNCLMMESMLNAYGASVKYFTHPQEALNAIKEEHFDAAFIDYWMPNMNGVDLAENIRIEQGESDDMFLVCVSGFDAAEILEEIETYSSREFGIFDTYIRKPLDTFHVETTLKSLVNKMNGHVVKESKNGAGNIVPFNGKAIDTYKKD